MKFDHPPRKTPRAMRCHVCLHFASLLLDSYLAHVKCRLNTSQGAELKINSSCAGSLFLVFSPALPVLGCGSAANAHNTIQTSEPASRLHPEMRHSSTASDMLMSFQDPPLSHSLCVESSPLGTEQNQVL